MAITAPLRARAARQRLRRDDGFALVAAIGVTLVVLMLAITVVTVAVRSEVGAGADRGRTLALAAAEGGLDAALLRLDGLASDTQALLTCQTSEQAWSSPGTSTVTTRYGFYTSATDTTPDPCPVGTTVYARVEATSTATYRFGASTNVRSVKAVVPLVGSPAPRSYALYTPAGLSIASGSSRIRGDVYGGGSMDCQSFARIDGNLYGSGFSSVQNCLADNLLGFRIDKPPVLSAVAADWAAEARTLGQMGWSCSNPAPAASTRTTATVVDARSCGASFAMAGTLSVRSDVTVFVAGMTTAGSLRLVSGDGQPHAVRFVVPTTSTSNTCAAGGFAIAGSVTADARTSVFLYTPGPVQISGTLDVSGAVYACRTQFGAPVYLNDVDAGRGALPPQMQGGGGYQVGAPSRTVRTGG